MFSRILVPVDIHEIEVAREALAPAVAIAKQFDSMMRLISVASPIPPAAPLASIPQTIFDSIGAYEKKRLDAFASTIDLPSERLSMTIRIGGVYPEVLAEAEEWSADLIVIGAHRRSMATFLLGSTASAVSRHANCTVMIVRSHLKARLI